MAICIPINCLLLRLYDFYYCNTSFNSRTLRCILKLLNLLRKVEGIGPVIPWQPDAKCIVVPIPNLQD